MTDANSVNNTEFIWPVRVYYEDTDSGGVVYYANYLKFIERARTECLRQWGYEQDELRDIHGIIFAVTDLAVKYHKPALFNDELEVKTCITKLGRASISFEQNIYRKNKTKQLCAAHVKIACLNAEKYSVQAIPQVVFEKLKHVVASN